MKPSLQQCVVIFAAVTGFLLYQAKPLAAQVTGSSIPIMTQTEINALADPVPGFIVFNSTTGELQINTGTSASPVFGSISVSGSGSSWETAGNALSGGEVLGSTTANDVNIVTDNITRMTIGGASGDVGVVNTLSIGGNLDFTGATSTIQNTAFGAVGFADDLTLISDADIILGNGSWIFSPGEAVRVHDDFTVTAGNVTITGGGLSVVGNSTLGDALGDQATVNGNLDVTNGVDITGGTLNASGAGNTIGDGTDAEQLEINGVDGGAIEVDVNGDMDISGTLTVGTFAFIYAGMLNDLDMNGYDIVDNTDNIVTVNDNLNVANSLTTTDDVNVGDDLVLTSLAGTISNSAGTSILVDDDITMLGGGDLIFDLGTSVIANTASDVTVQDNLAVTGNTTMSDGTLSVTKTAAGSAIAVNNSNGTNAIALNVSAGGGRTILSHGTGAGVIPTDVSVWNATGNVTLPGSVENGQILYIVNTSGAAITVTGVTGGTAAGFNNNDVRGYIYSAGWFEMP